MDSSSIDLPGSEIEAIRVSENQVAIRFSKAYIIQTMSGSVERTRWYQSGELVFEGATIDGEYPAEALICVGGDVGENIYTYRDMIPIPFKSQGRAFCDLRFEGSELHLKVEANAVELKMEDRPHYIEHIRQQ